MSPAAVPCRKAPFRRTRRSLAAETARTSGVSECILHNLLLHQDERGTGRTLRRDTGVTLPMHLSEPICDACSHALLETFRCTAKANTRQPTKGSQKRRHFSVHRAVNNLEQIGGERHVGFEAEEHVAGYHGIPRDPNFAVTKLGDRRDAAVDGRRCFPPIGTSIWRQRPREHRSPRWKTRSAQAGGRPSRPPPWPLPRCTRWTRSYRQGP